MKGVVKVKHQPSNLAGAAKRMTQIWPSNTAAATCIQPIAASSKKLQSFDFQNRLIFKSGWFPQGSLDRI
jgi:hypothetical protein